MKCVPIATHVEINGWGGCPWHEYSSRYPPAQLLPQLDGRYVYKKCKYLNGSTSVLAKAIGLRYPEAMNHIETTGRQKVWEVGTSQGLGLLPYFQPTVTWFNSPATIG